MNNTHLPQKPEILPPLQKPSKTKGGAKRPKFAHPDPETDRISKQHHEEQVKRDKENRAKQKKEEDRRLAKAYESIQKERSLTPAQLGQLGRMVTAEWCDRHEIYPAAMAFLFKYHGSDLQRVRFMEPSEGHIEIVQRYSQPNYSPPEAYYCPLWEAAVRGLPQRSWERTCEDTNQSLVITEGEFKAIAACRIGIACVALGGTSSYSSKARGWTWLPTLDRVKWKGRHVYIVNDSDAVNNIWVRIAETKLALRLIQRGAIVHIVRIPPDGDKKVGLDDYIIKLERQRKNAHEAVQKLLHDTPEWNKDLPLHEMNAEFVYCKKPSCVVELDTMDLIGCQQLVSEVLADKQHIVSTGKDKEKPVSTARAWMHWEGRNKVDYQTFKPGQPLFIDERGKRLLNRWQGWACEPVKGGVEPYLELLDHVFRDAKCEIWEKGVLVKTMKSSVWFEQWAANRVQSFKRSMHAVVLHGIPGTGKSMLGMMIGLVHGVHFQLIDQNDLDSSFTGHMECKTFMLADEAATKQNKYSSLPERLKSYITCPTVRINEKFIKKYDMPNEVQLLFTTNHDDAMHIEDKDRRYFVHHITAGEIGKEFRDRLGKWMEDPGSPAALLYHLMHVDCSGYDPFGPAPMTEAKKEMQDASRTALDNWMKQLSEDPESVVPHLDYRPDFKDPGYTQFIKDPKVPDQATPEEVLCMFQGNGRGQGYYNPASVGLALKRWKFERAGGDKKVTKDAGKAKRLWWLRKPK